MLPALPAREIPYSANIYGCLNLLEHTFSQASGLLSHGSFELHRVLFHKNTILRDALPLLLDLETCAEDEGLPLAWLEDVSQRFGALLTQITEAEQTADGRYVVFIFDYLVPILIAAMC